MAGLNKAILIGNLGADPELRHTSAGVPVINFSIATSEKFKDKAGQTQDKTEWHNIIAWNKLAEICSSMLQKGSTVYVEGKIQTRQYNDKNNVLRYVTEITINYMQLLKGGKEKQDNPYRSPDMPPEAAAAPGPMY